MINGNNNERINYNGLISRLLFIRTKYLTSNNVTVLDKSPFQEFTISCFGQTVDTMHAARLKADDNHSKNKLVKFRHKPTGKHNKIPNIKFPNQSGNEQRNSFYK